MGKSIRAKGKRRIRLLKREIASKVHFPKHELAIQAALAAAAAAPPAEIHQLRGPNEVRGGAEERRGRQGAPTAMAIEGRQGAPTAMAIEGGTPPDGTGTLDGTGTPDGTPTTAAVVATEEAGQKLKKSKKKPSTSKRSKQQSKKHRKWSRTFGK